MLWIDEKRIQNADAVLPYEEVDPGDDPSVDDEGNRFVGPWRSGHPGSPEFSGVHGLGFGHGVTVLKKPNGLRTDEGQRFWAIESESPKLHAEEATGSSTRGR